MYKVRARIVLTEDHLAALEAFCPNAISQIRELAVGESREERKSSQVLGNALLGHRPDSTGAT